MFWCSPPPPSRAKEVGCWHCCSTSCWQEMALFVALPVPTLSTISLPSPLYSPLLRTSLKWKWPMLILFSKMLNWKSISRFYRTWWFYKLMRLRERGSLTWAGLCCARGLRKLLNMSLPGGKGAGHKFRVDTGTVAAGDGYNKHHKPQETRRQIRHVGRQRLWAARSEDGEWCSQAGRQG